MSTNAFMSDDYSSDQEFCIKFLCGSEFNMTTLRKLAPSAPSQEKKEEIALRITDALEKGKLTTNEILLTYVKQPRTWLSFKHGQYTCIPEFKTPTILLKEFGDEGWYGPIQDSHKPQKWYIRTQKIVDYFRKNSCEANSISERYIRWSVIAEIGHNYIALSWDGFTFSQLTDNHIDAAGQFPFWVYIPCFFNELTDCFKGQWHQPNLHQLVLHQMWDKYINTSANDFCYRWRHLRIRAESEGVAMNAHSSGVTEIDVMGLQALSRHLARAAVETLGFSNDVEKITEVENAMLHTLIKERGTKSYEFSLDRDANTNEADTNCLKHQERIEHLFKAHCYFGLKPHSKTQDSLQHLKCYKSYGGSTGVLNFLLKELGL